MVLFGAVLTGAAFPATDAPARALLAAMGGVELATLDRPMRFATALLGAVTLGWGLTLAAAIPAIERLPAPYRHRAWRRVLAAILVWFVVDSGLSFATGFALNALSNSLFLVALLIPLVRGRAVGA